MNSFHVSSKQKLMCCLLLRFFYLLLPVSFSLLFILLRLADDGRDGAATHLFPAEQSGVQKQKMKLKKIPQNELPNLT